MAQDMLRANREIGRQGWQCPQEGTDKLRYMVDVAGNSVLSSSQPMEIG